MADLVAALNPMQRQAVELPAEHALILAGAGSGKTKVLTTRIAWLIANGKARPSQILAVTFTNKAAREMRTRLESMLTVDTSRMWVGTFHGIAHKILRLHAEEAGLPRTFQIIDSSDQLSLIKRIMKDAGIDPEQHDPRSFQSAINNFKESGMRAASVGVSEAGKEGMGVYRAYEGRCQREGLVDFAELLLRTVELFERNQILRDHYAERFRFLLVDEFQDTNVLQFRWIKMLADPKGGSAVFCVGDDDQSIYAFRGARVGNMADFIRDYGVKHVVKLEQNYRSTSHILDAANAVIANNENRMGKNLWTQSGAGERIGLYNAADDREEARSVTQDIMSRHRSGTAYGSCAVLYRNNAQSRVIEQYFTANGVPYRIYGGLRFFDRQEVKDVTAYLRVLSNPDDTSVLRVINHPPRGIGATSLQRVMDEARGRALSLWQTMNDWQGDPVSMRRVQPFLDLVAHIREVCEPLPLDQVIEKVIELSGLKAYYEAQRDKDIRLENLAEIVNAAAGYCSENGIEADASAFAIVEGGEMSALDGFLAQATLEADDKNDQQPSDAVQMMTVHASKGLEFDNVYLCGLEEGLFPHAARDGEDENTALSEERRLMYVAMTRARQRLRISWSAARMLYGSMRDNLRSSFIDEIPIEHLQDLGGGGSEQGSRQGYASGYGSNFAGRDRYGSQYGNGQRGAYGSRGQGGYGGYEHRGSTTGYGAASTRSSTGVYSRDGSSWKNTGIKKASEFLKQSSTGSGLPSLRSSASSTPNQWNLQPGDKIEHEKFGPGLIMRMVNVADADGATVHVKFKTGMKELLLKFAAPKMKKVC